MAQKKVKSMKEKLSSGGYSSPIPFGADAENIDLADGHNLQEALGIVKLEEKGTIQKQLDDVSESISWGTATDLPLAEESISPEEIGGIE